MLPRTLLAVMLPLVSGCAAAPPRPPVDAVYVPARSGTAPAGNLSLAPAGLAPAGATSLRCVPRPSGLGTDCTPL